MESELQGSERFLFLPILLLIYVAYNQVWSGWSESEMQAETANSLVSDR